jgi:hypothetical protein
MQSRRNLNCTGPCHLNKYCNLGFYRFIESSEDDS